jgi:hypothetical protein
MKRIFFLLIAVISMTVSRAQGVIDGLRYGTDNTLGTARYTALSGAFGALGGDLSAIADNPAGSAVFITNEMSVSLGVIDRENKANYFGRAASAVDTDVTLNQAGGVFVFTNSDENSKWKKFTIGLNYNNSKNHDNDLFISGMGNRSIASYFVNRAQGIPLELLQLQGGESVSDLYAYLGQTEGTAAQDAFLGYQGYIFDPLEDAPGNTQYVSNVGAGRFNQEYYQAENGFNGKYTVNFAAQYTEDFYFGINLNAHSIDYFQQNFLYETNSNAGSLVNEIGFENNLSVLGNGFSAQIGGIAKITDEFRLGLTYDTPTWYQISEETTQYLETVRTVEGDVITEIINPNVLNVFADYNLRTPGRYAASAAYVFGKQGLISLDYSYKDFSQTKFSSDFSGEFAMLNSAIANTLKGASSLRVGGEYRINELSLRGGMRYEESPYSNGSTLGDLTGFSLGIGYDFGNYNFDLAWSRTQQDNNKQLYSTGLTSIASIDGVSNNIVFTLGFNL